MSRIRSVHPGLWTDERFVSVQPLARLLFMGIWNECDDQGVFEWSPLKLKMRILPADNADADALLEELEGAGSVMRFAASGKVYGVVRSFSRFQRPKKPTAQHPISELAIAFAAGSSEQVPHQYGTGGEIGAQMEEEGGRMEEDTEDTGVSSGAVAPKIPNAIELRAAVFNSGVALLTGSGSTEKQARSMLGRWRNDYGDPAVLDALAAATANEISEPIPWIRRRLETINGQRNRLRGTRPDPALDLLRQGDAQLAAERSREAPDWGAWPSLPAVGSG